MQIFITSFILFFFHKNVDKKMKFMNIDSIDFKITIQMSFFLNSLSYFAYSGWFVAKMKCWVFIFIRILFCLLVLEIEINFAEIALSLTMYFDYLKLGYLHMYFWRINNVNKTFLSEVLKGYHMYYIRELLQVPEIWHSELLATHIRGRGPRQ